MYRACFTRLCGCACVTESKKRVKQNFQEVIRGSAVGEAFTARTYIMEKAMSDNIPDKITSSFFWSELSDRVIFQG